MTGIHGKRNRDSHRVVAVKRAGIVGVVAVAALGSFLVHLTFTARITSPASGEILRESSLLKFVGGKGNRDMGEEPEEGETQKCSHCVCWTLGKRGRGDGTEYL